MEHEKVQEGAYGAFLSFLKARKYAGTLGANIPSDPLYSTPRSLMQKVLEHQKWIEFNSARMCWELGRIDPRVAMRIVRDLPAFPVCP